MKNKKFNNKVKKTIYALLTTAAIGLNACNKNDSAISLERKFETNFQEEKILTISAGNYCESVGKKLSDYRLVGVGAMNGKFRFKIPAGTEVIVDYRVTIDGDAFFGTSGYEAGTALILKTPQNKLIQ